MNNAIPWKHPRIIAFLLFICLASIGTIEYYENSIDLPVHNWIGSQKKKLPTIDTGEFCFAVLGDNKGTYDLFARILKRLQEDPEVLFTIHLGDMVRHRAPLFYKQFYENVNFYYRKPFFAIPGNHDVKWGGGEIYRSMFGPRYYTFRFGGNQFVCMDASYDYTIDEKQLRWLERILSEARDADHRFVFMHQPLYDPRGNGRKSHCLAQPTAVTLERLFSSHHVSHIFSSHIHGFYRGEWNHTPFTISGGAGTPLARVGPPEAHFYHYLKVYVSKDNIRVEAVRISREKPEEKTNRQKTESISPSMPNRFDYDYLEKIEFILYLFVAIFALILLYSTIRKRTRFRS